MSFLYSNPKTAPVFSLLAFIRRAQDVYGQVETPMKDQMKDQWRQPVLKLAVGYGSCLRTVKTAE